MGEDYTPAAPEQTMVEARDVAPESPPLKPVTVQDAWDLAQSEGWSFPVFQGQLKQEYGIDQITDFNAPLPRHPRPTLHALSAPSVDFPDVALPPPASKYFTPPMGFEEAKAKFEKDTVERIPMTTAGVGLGDVGRALGKVAIDVPVRAVGALWGVGASAGGAAGELLQDTMSEYRNVFGDGVARDIGGPASAILQPGEKEPPARGGIERAQRAVQQHIKTLVENEEDFASNLGDDAMDLIEGVAGLIVDTLGFTGEETEADRAEGLDYVAKQFAEAANVTADLVPGMVAHLSQVATEAARGNFDTARTRPLSTALLIAPLLKGPSALIKHGASEGLVRLATKLREAPEAGRLRGLLAKIADTAARKAAPESMKVADKGRGPYVRGPSAKELARHEEARATIDAARAQFEQRLPEVTKEAEQARRELLDRRRRAAVLPPSAELKAPEVVAASERATTIARQKELLERGLEKMAEPIAPPPSVEVPRGPTLPAAEVFEDLRSGARQRGAFGRVEVERAVHQIESAFPPEALSAQTGEAAKPLPTSVRSQLGELASRLRGDGAVVDDIARRVVSELESGEALARTREGVKAIAEAAKAEGLTKAEIAEALRRKALTGETPEWYVKALQGVHASKGMVAEAVKGILTDVPGRLATAARRAQAKELIDFIGSTERTALENAEAARGSRILAVPSKAKQPWEVHEVEGYVKANDQVREWLGLDEIERPKGVSPDVEYDYFVPAKLESRIRWQAKAEAAMRGDSNWQQWQQYIKRNLTARNASSAINNLGSNIIYRFIQEGDIAPLSKRLYDAQRLWTKYKGGKDLPPDDLAMMQAISRSGVAETTLLNAELAVARETAMDRIPGLSHMNKALEGAYNFGDEVMKVERAITTYRKVEKLLNILEPGKYIDLEVGPKNTVRLTRVKKAAVATRKGGNEPVKGPFFRVGKMTYPIDSPKIKTILARAGAKSANDILFDYSSVSRWENAIKSAPLLGVGSPFLTWMYKALDIPFLKKGLVSRLLEGPTSGVRTNSPKITRRLWGQSALRAMNVGKYLSTSVAWANEDKDRLRRLLSYLPKEEQARLIRVSTNPMVVREIPLGSLDFADPSRTFMRLVNYPWQLLSNSSTEEMIERLKHKGIIDAELAWMTGADGKPLPKYKDLYRAVRAERNLLIKTKAGQKGTIADLMKLAGLQGGFLMDLVGAANSQSGRGSAVDPLRFARESVPLLIGGTTYRIIRALAGLTEPGSTPYSLTGRAWQETELDDTTRDDVAWVVRTIFGKYWRPRNVDRANDRYFSAMEGTLKRGMLYRLKGGLRVAEARGDDELADKLEKQIDEITELIEDTTQQIKDEYEDYIESLRPEPPQSAVSDSEDIDIDALLEAN